MIEDEYFPAKLAICANGGYLNAEDRFTSFLYIPEFANMFL